MIFKSKIIRLLPGLLISIPPGLLIISAAILKAARGPYWMGSNYDPDYIYLLNSLNIAHLIGVGHFDHPGTPVQVFGAIIIRLAYLFRTSTADSFKIDVLRNAEFYLEVINRSILVLNALLAIALGFIVYKLTHKIWLALLLELSPFCSFIILNYGLTKVSPEPMIVTVSLILTILTILRLELKKFPLREHWLALLYALLIGLGIATKITFFPLAIFPLFALTKLRYHLIYLAGISIFFLFFTLPIYKKYRAFVNWVYQLFFHTGRHGTGTSGVIDSSYFTHIRLVEDWSPFLFIILAISVLILILIFLIPKTRKLVSSRYYLVLVGISLAEIAGVAMVAKQPGQQYFLPFLALVGLWLFVIISLVRETQIRLFSVSLNTLIILIFVWNLTVTSSDLQIFYHSTSAETKKFYQVYNTANGQFDQYTKIYYFRSSAPVDALKFGDAFSLGANSAALRSLFPDTIYYDIGSGTYSRWNKVMTFSQIKQQYGDKLVFQGTPFDKQYKNDPEYKPKLPLEDVLNGEEETIYRIGPTQ